MTDDRAFSVTSLDHIVLTVPDVEAAVAWYRDVLGLAPERLDQWRDGKVPFVSMRVDATTLIDLLPGERSGVNADHVALVVTADVRTLADRDDLVVRHGPAQVFGARGMGWGLYLEDPAGNVVELRSYPD